MSIRSTWFVQTILQNLANLSREDSRFRTHGGALSDRALVSKEAKSASATSSSLLPPSSVPGQDTLMTAFQAALVAAVRSVVLAEPDSQHNSTSDSSEWITSATNLIKVDRLSTGAWNRIGNGHDAFRHRCGLW